MSKYEIPLEDPPRFFVAIPFGETFFWETLDWKRANLGDPFAVIIMAPKQYT